MTETERLRAENESLKRDYALQVEKRENAEAEIAALRECWNCRQPVEKEDPTDNNMVGIDCCYMTLYEAFEDHEKKCRADLARYKRAYGELSDG
jgi:hypothetical protein